MTTIRQHLTTKLLYWFVFNISDTVVMYSHPDHFINVKNPEILTYAFIHRELLIKEILLKQDQPPQINVDDFSTSLYHFNT